MIKFCLMALASLMLISTAAFATPAACLPGTLDTYLTPSFSCSINALTFGAWSYASATVPSTAIEVTPITTLGYEGFNFNTLWTVNNTTGGGLMTEDSTIGFTAAGPGITDLELSFNGSFTGTGSANVSETYCFNHPVAGCASGPSNGGQIQVTNPPPTFSDVVFFSPQTSISVLKDIGVSTGSGFGSASISQVTNQFSSPEPLSFVLLGSGLLGLGLLRKRISR